MIDISNKSPGSQLEMFTLEKKELIISHLKSNEIIYKSMINDELRLIVSISQD